MNLVLYQIDAFASKLFTGNPAAVIPLDKWIDDALMQNLAMENNLAETVFFVPRSPSTSGGDWGEADIRWFTPAAEINLCGHATLASAYVLYNILGYDKPSITFHSRSGPLIITRDKDIFFMDFPSWKPERISDYPGNLEEAIGVKEIVGVYKHRDLLVELNKEEDVRNAQPDFTLIKKQDIRSLSLRRGMRLVRMRQTALKDSKIYQPLLSGQTRRGLMHTDQTLPPTSSPDSLPQHSA